MSYSVLQAAAGIGAAAPICNPGEVWDPVAGRCVVPSVPVPTGPMIGPEPLCVDVHWTDTTTGVSGTNRMCRSGYLDGPYGPNNVRTAHAPQAALKTIGFYNGPVDGDPWAPGLKEAIAALLTKYGIALGPYDQKAQLGFPDVFAPLVWEYAQKMAGMKGRGDALTAGGGTTKKVGPGSGGGYLPSQPTIPNMPPPLVAPAPPPPEEPKRGAMDLWNGLSTGEKVAVVGAGLLGLVLIGFVVKKTVFKKNRRRRTRGVSSLSAARTKDRVGAESSRKRHRRLIHRLASEAPPATMRVPYKANGRKRKYAGRATYRGHTFGRASAPAKYKKLGARRAEHYAWPDGWMYPIHSAKYTRAASAKFAKWKNRYPPAMRKTIARRIDQAKRRFRIGEYRR